MSNGDMGGRTRMIVSDWLIDKFVLEKKSRSQSFYNGLMMRVSVIYQAKCVFL